jgi:hypothetical protein
MSQLSSIGYYASQSNKEATLYFYLFIERLGEKATTHLRVSELLVIESVGYLLCILYF